MSTRCRLFLRAVFASIFVWMVALVPMVSAHAQSTSQEHTLSTQSTGQVINVEPTWVRLALPYVHVVHSTASIDPSLSRVVDPQTLSQVKLAVSRYNALSLAAKSPSSVSLSPTAVSPSGACRERFVRYVNWWGTSYYLNSCLVNDIAFGLLGGAGLAGVIAALCPPCAPIAGTLAAVLGIYSGWLYWADNHCGGAGAYLNESWLGQVWVSTVC
jgi:hypothetical protein